MATLTNSLIFRLNFYFCKHLLNGKEKSTAIPYRDQVNYYLSKSFAYNYKNVLYRRPISNLEFVLLNKI